MIDTVNNLLLLQLTAPIKLQQLPLHPLILQQLHAVLLVEVYELDLLVLLLNVILVRSRLIIYKFGLVITVL